MDVVCDALSNEENFAIEQISESQKMSEVQKTVKTKVLELFDAGVVTQRDKKLITGLNENNNVMHAHCFKPVVPYVYPLFKIHKLSQEQLESKVIPPIRLVHATEEGPLYRLEKWVSPDLTKLSRWFCKDEFILDSPALISCIKEINNSGSLKNNTSKSINLFTLDVINLYPSIDPAFALNSLKEALKSSDLDELKQYALETFTELILKESFVCFQGKVYKGNKGIPTGNCVSRQIADIMLHDLLFSIIKPQMEHLWQLICIWKRYIDDVFGVWTGTERQFHIFVKTLNKFAKRFGIQFGDCQFGKMVKYLDMKIFIYLNDDNVIEYSLYKKDTDARLFLQTDSFHPKHVFKSVVFSQMMRVIQRNSQDHTCVEDLSELKSDLSKCGHHENTMEKIEPLAVQRVIEKELSNSQQKSPEIKTEKLVFSVKYFKELNDLKRLVHTLKSDIVHLCGDINVTFAIRKHPSVGNTVVKNRRLSECSQIQEGNHKTQKCGAKGCLTCPYLFDANDIIIVNGSVVKLDFRLCCKDKSVIYLAQCQICNKKLETNKDDSYFGQTVIEMHLRMNLHRDKFTIDNRLLFEKSALSMHCYLEHKKKFSMKYFKLGLVKKVRPTDLDREENNLIQKHRTKIWGLNRIVVVK